MWTVMVISISWALVVTVRHTMGCSGWNKCVPVFRSLRFSVRELMTVQKCPFPRVSNARVTE